jgi:ferric-dicitrate binding protein FerR (iron transport regulator)
LTTEDIILNEEEWEEFKTAHDLSPEVSGKLWDGINRGTSPPSAQSAPNAPDSAPPVAESILSRATSTPSPTQSVYTKWFAVAASVLLVAALSWLLILRKQATGRIDLPAVATTQQLPNSTPQKKTLTLSDGSTVELQPNSALSYSETFSSVKREVQLKGSAVFNIAREVARPFSVYSNGVLITVLGTRFTVSSFDSNRATKIVLHEGKVMVKVSPASGGAKKDDRAGKNEYYLDPGDIFIYKPMKRSSSAIHPDPVAPADGILADSLPAARIIHLEKDKRDGYIFNNYPLDVVFDQLQIIYNTKIEYNKSELGNRTFIGKIDKKDSLYPILQSIALLNKFHLQKQVNGFIIGATSAR